MPLELIKFAFSAGEISPTFKGRQDLTQYDFGLDTALNWYVDYRGGLSTRPGTEFLDYIMHDDKDVQMFQYRYAPNTANTFVLLFGDFYLRFIQDGAYVLESAVNISAISQGIPGTVVTATPHGFASGDWVKITGVNGMTQLNNRTYEVLVISAVAFQLLDPFGNNFGTTLFPPYTSGGTVARIYTITTPYPAANLATLNLHQYRNVVTITHIYHATTELTRVSDTSWSLNYISYSNEIFAPSGLTATAITAGTSGVAFMVTSVSVNGEESLPTFPIIVDNTNDYQSSAGGIVLEWNPQTDAVSYNVYRSLISYNETDLTVGGDFGYIGSTKGAKFTDNNIIPDFTTTPPKQTNPFEHGSVIAITVTAGGAGYPRNATTVSVSGGPGFGFSGYPVVTDAGEIIGVVVLQGGLNYTGATVSFAGGGAGATATVEVTPLTGQKPGLSTVHQQRRVYAGSVNQPMTVWGSKPRQFKNFDVADIVLANDSYEFEIDSEEVTPIKHIMSVKGGMLVLTDQGVWIMRSSSVEESITPLNALAEPQTYTGVSDLQPLRVDSDLLYIETRGYTTRLLEYNDFSKLYSGLDISILSNHFFTPDNSITHWGYTSDPYRIVWCRKEDGRLLSLTASKEQKLFAWTQHETRGYFDRLISVREGKTDSIYLIVIRYIQGRRTKMLERFRSREFVNIEEAFCVDCGLSLMPLIPSPGITLTIDRSITPARFVANASFWNAGHLGFVIRAGGCKAVVTSIESGTTVRAQLLRDYTDILPQDPLQRTLTITEWTVGPPYTTISGLWHLEGEPVVANADGNVVTGLTVLNGEIELPAPATMVHVGMGYTCEARTLPLTTPSGVIEGRRKRVVGVLPRLYQSRGLQIGVDKNKLYDVRERTNEIPGEPNTPVSGIIDQKIEPRFDPDGQFWLIERNPMPASILGFVVDTDIGDDPD